MDIPKVDSEVNETWLRGQLAKYGEVNVTSITKCNAGFGLMSSVFLAKVVINDQIVDLFIKVKDFPPLQTRKCYSNVINFLG